MRPEVDMARRASNGSVAHCRYESSGFRLGLRLGVLSARGRQCRPLMCHFNAKHFCETLFFAPTWVSVVRVWHESLSVLTGVLAAPPW